MASVRKKAKSKDEKKLISKLDQQIRSYVQEFGTSRDSELLDQAIADINKHHKNQTRKSGQPVIIHPLLEWQITFAGPDWMRLQLLLPSFMTLLKTPRLPIRISKNVTGNGTRILLRDSQKSKKLRNQKLR